VTPKIAGICAKSPFLRISIGVSGRNVSFVTIASTVPAKKSSGSDKGDCLKKLIQTMFFEFNKVCKCIKYHESNVRFY